MTLLTVAAVLGACLGLLFRRTVPAVAVALATAGLAQFGAMGLARALSGRAGTAQLASQIQGVVGQHPGALVATLAAAGCGAAIAGLLAGWADGRKQSTVFIPGDAPRSIGRKHRRSPSLAAIEERPGHAAAESRIQTLLKQ